MPLLCFGKCKGEEKGTATRGVSATHSDKRQVLPGKERLSTQLYQGKACGYLQSRDQQHLPGDESADSVRIFFTICKRGVVVIQMPLLQALEMPYDPSAQVGQNRRSWRGNIEPSKKIKRTTLTIHREMNYDSMSSHTP